MRLSKFNYMARGIPEKGMTVVHNTLTQGQAVLEDRHLEIMESGGPSGLGPEELTALEEAGILVPDNVDEDSLFDLFYNQVRFRNSVLDVTILPSLSCNFACGYCYEGEHTRGMKLMSPETAGLALEWMKVRAKENKVSRIDIQYHGGEPLLNVPAIERIGGEMTAFCRDKGIRLISHMVSNGYLLDRKTALRIKSVGVTSVKITLDGPEEVHDSFRFLRGGGGSYRTIMNNLADIKDILDISIGGNYTDKTAGRIPELLDDLVRHGIGPKSVKRISFTPVMPGEKGSRAASLDSGCIPADWRPENLLKVREEMKKRGFGGLEEPGINPCPAVMAAHFTINYDGEIFKCPAVVDRPERSVGNVGAEFRYNAEMLKSLGYNTFDNEKCRGCLFLPHCAGGCRYLALVETGNFHDFHCCREMLEGILKDHINSALEGDAVR